MNIIEKLKWAWDPRTEEEKLAQKIEKATPLQCRTQHLKVYISGTQDPYEMTFSKKDQNFGSMGTLRLAGKESFKGFLNEWLDARGHKGIRIGSVWYSPESIERIELGDQTVENI